MQIAHSATDALGDRWPNGSITLPDPGHNSFTVATVVVYAERPRLAKF